MTQPLAVVNETEAFLAGFSGKFLIRLLHREYDEPTKQPERLKPRQFYISQGELSDLLPTLHGLNDGRSPDHQFNVFMCVNDPGGLYAGKRSIYEMRAIYQDADVEATALIEPEIAGQRAHIVLQTSPGKRQRFWHTASVEPHRQPAIHEQMVARHHHDPSTEGPQRLVRMPGFLNWKKDYLPNGVLVSIVGSISSHPPLTREQVFKHFGQRENGDLGDPNLASGNANIQQSGDLPKGSKVAVLKDHPKWGARDRQVDAEHRARDAHEIPSHTLKTDDLLNVLSLIDPDTHYGEWRRVLAALHYMAGGREWGKDIAERWSALAIHRFETKGFEGTWAGLSDGVANPAHWATLRWTVEQERFDNVSRARRKSASFASFEEKYGKSLDFDFRQTNYPQSEVLSNGRIGVTRDSQENIAVLHAECGYTVHKDTFHNCVMVTSADFPEPRRLNEDHIITMHSRAQRTGYKPSRLMIRELTQNIASERKRDPVREYLGSLPDWDGIERLNTFFQRHFDTPDTPSVREVFALLMMAMVRRTRKDLVKFDLMPILEGKQGWGKSTVFEAVLPDPSWFTRSCNLSDEQKRLYGSMQGKLIIEFQELAGLRKTDSETVKKLVSQGTDEWIANYAVEVTTAPRRCVFVGTTNEAQYLRDLTGNRRHPIIVVNKELNTDAVKAERDQLWAEAVFDEEYFGELRLSPKAIADMERLQEDREEMNSEVRSIVRELTDIKEGFIQIESIWDRLDVPFNQRSKRNREMQSLRRDVETKLNNSGWSKPATYKHNGVPIWAHVKRIKKGPVPEIKFDGKKLAPYNTDDIEDILK